MYPCSIAKKTEALTEHSWTSAICQKQLQTLYLSYEFSFATKSHLIRSVRSVGKQTAGNVAVMDLMCQTSLISLCESSRNSLKFTRLSSSNVSKRIKWLLILSAVLLRTTAHLKNIKLRFMTGLTSNLLGFRLANF